MGTSSSATNPTQDFLARMGDGRLFDMGASTVKYGTLGPVNVESINCRIVSSAGAPYMYYYCGV